MLTELFNKDLETTYCNSWNIKFRIGMKKSMNLVALDSLVKQRMCDFIGGALPSKTSRISP